MSSFRLSHAIVPENYTIYLKPNIPEKTFIGTNTISFRKNEDYDHAELYAELITIKAITQNGISLKYTHEDTRLNIFGQSLEASPVKIEFEGSLDHECAGWYYVDDRTCSTQFEAVHARKAFPCFDEPSIKAVFQFTIEAPLNLVVLNNMPEKSVTNNGETMIHEFYPTPPMASFIVAYAIGDFISVHKKTSRGLFVDLYAEPGNEDLMQYPLDEAIKAVEWYEQFFDLEYPLPRLQFLSMAKFLYGGEENYGLIICKDTCLLCNPKVTPESVHRHCVEVIFHEIAHQWSGNGITPKWWNSIWLSEGFASIFPFIAFDDIHPDWNEWETFLKDKYERGMTADYSTATHPINFKIETPAEIESSFDFIEYDKGASVICMLFHYIGKEKLRKVMRTYFNRFMNKNAETSDLCDVFSEVLQMDMKPYFDCWINQPCFPLITLSEDCIISQTVFIDDFSSNKPWIVPLDVSYKINGEVKFQKIILSDKTIQLEGMNEAEWIMVNYHSHAFCLTKYHDKWFQGLCRAVNNHELDSINSYTFLRDQSLLGTRIGYNFLLPLLESYKTCSQPLVIDRVVTAYSSLYNEYADIIPEIEPYGKNIFSSILEIIGKEEESNESNQIADQRAQIFNILAFKCKSEEILEYGINLFYKYKEGEKVPEYLHKFAFKCGALRVDGSIEYLKQIATNKSDIHGSKDAYLALGFVPKESIMSILEFALNYPDDLLIHVIAAVSSNPNHTDELWEFYKAHYRELNNLFGTTMFTLERIIIYICSCYKTEEKADEIEEFLRDHLADVAQNGAKRGVASIRVMDSIRKGFSKSLREYFDSHTI